MNLHVLGQRWVGFRMRKSFERDLRFWSRLPPFYDEMLVDFKKAEPTSRQYENVEDELLEKVIEKVKKSCRPIVLVELGVGTGRYLQMFGQKWIDNENILLFVAVDFSLGMIGKSYSMLSKRTVNLEKELGRRLILVRGRAETFSLSICRHEKFKDASPVLFCMFNTLGNIGDRNRRRKVLYKIKKTIGPDGMAVVSVFNRDRFTPLAFQYYGTLEMAPIVPTDAPQKFIHFDLENGDVTTPDFYSHWFNVRELEDMISEVGLEKVPDPDLNMVGSETGDERAERGIIYTIRWMEKQ